MILSALVAVFLLIPPPQPKVSAFPGERVVTSETPEVAWPPEAPERPSDEDGVVLVFHEPSWKLQRMRLSEMPESVRDGAGRVGSNSISGLDYQWWWWNDVVWNYEREPGEFEAYIVVTHAHIETRLHTDLYVLPEATDAQVALERGYHDIAEAYYEIFDDAVRQTLTELMLGQRMVGYGSTAEEAEDDAAARINAILQAELELVVFDRQVEADEAYFELTQQMTDTEVDVAATVAAALEAAAEGEAQERYESFGMKPALEPDAKRTAPTTAPTTLPATAPATAPAE